MPKVVLATNNPGKVEELRAILADTGLDLLTAGDVGDLPDVAETGETFRDNALHKAEQISRATGLAAIADDSGLQVDALDGRPGVRSARYAGPEQDSAANVEKLLQEMKDVPAGSRGARFVCVAAYAGRGGKTLTARATCEGSIAAEARGTGGFGYDPVFVPAGHDRTMAELGPEEKNAISHRGKAFRALREQLRAADIAL